MHDSPRPDDLLAGVSRFLADQIGPTIEDRALAFRLKVALFLLATIRRELQLGDGHAHQEWSRFAELLGYDHPLPTDPHERRLAFTQLNADLTEHIRAGDVDEQALRALMMASLRDKLAVVQPRFDTRMDSENLLELGD
jgi:hypothetical protein